jgi:hypothetical protein
MLKNKKKKTKTEAQEKTECGQNFEGLFENFTEKKMMVRAFRSKSRVLYHF